MRSFSFYSSLIVRNLWRCLAVSVVVLAIFLTLLRLSLPYVNEHKHHLESFLQDQYDVVLQIGKIDAQWNGLGPELVLQDMHVQAKQDSPTQVSVASTSINIDFWQSITSFALHSERFELSGLVVDIDLDRSKATADNQGVIDILKPLFLEQLKQFSVSDSQIRTKKGEAIQVVHVEQVSWLNKDEHHQGVGRFQVADLAANSASFVLDLYGKADDLSGTFYANATALDLSPYFTLLMPEQALPEGQANFYVWADINSGELNNVFVDIDHSPFVWRKEQQSLQTAITDGEILLQKSPEGWRINVSNLALQIAEQSLISQWSGLLDKDYNLTMTSQQAFEINPLMPLLGFNLNQYSEDVIENTSPKATINRLQLYLADSAVGVSAKVGGIHWQAYGNVPGLSDADLSVAWFDEQGYINVKSKQSKLALTSLLGVTTTIEYADMHVYASYGEQGLEFVSPKMTFKSDIVELNGKANYQTNTGHLTLAQKISSMPLKDVSVLFPNGLMGKNTVDYLERAFLSGQIEQAEVLWHGDLKAYPYKQHNGIFQSKVAIKNSGFLFDPTWPALSNLDLDLLFENEALHMRSAQGNLLEVGMNSLYAVIPNLGIDPVLTIDIDATSSGQGVADLMMQSSLQNSLGKTLQQLPIEGNLDTKLQLDIPLKNTVVTAIGDVYFSDNTIAIPTIKTEIEHVFGTLSFNNDVIKASGLNTHLLGQPTSLSINGKSEDKAYLVDVALGGVWQVKPLLDQYHPKLNAYVNGHSEWSADVDLFFEQKDFEYSVELTSDLQQVQSSLPGPFASEKEQALPLMVNASGDNTASIVKLALGSDVVFDGVLPHKEVQFSRAHLAIGQNDLVGLGLGFSVSASLPAIDFEQWRVAVTDIVEGLPKLAESDTSKPVLASPKRIFVTTEDLLIANQHINNVEATGKRDDDKWSVALNAKQARGNIFLHQDWFEKGIKIEADFIQLSQVENSELSGTSLVDISKIPPIDFTCYQCQIGNKRIGKVEVIAMPNQGALDIVNFAVTNPYGNLKASGTWLNDEVNSITSLKGSLQSKDLDAMLGTLDVVSPIKDSDANIAFDVNWQDTPYNFAVNTLSGDIEWALGDGYLAEVDDKGVRILSVLSLQSIVRKLSLDFRDVFAKGFFYDEMTGTFQVSNGIVNTEDMEIAGAAGQTSIRGYTNLNDEVLNYRIGFTPNVTSSLPLLVYWMVNPPTAIAALALDKVLTSAKVISHVEMSLTGTLSEPVTTVLDRTSKEVTLPAQNRPTMPEQDTSKPLDADLRVDLEVNNG